MTKVLALDHIGQLRRGENEEIVFEPLIDIHIKDGMTVITTAQAEAYADARVREALQAQQPYGYHIISEANGNGIAFCTADHSESITEFLQQNPGTTIRAVALIPTK